MQTTKASLLSAIKDPENQLRWAEFYDLYTPWIARVAKAKVPEFDDDEIECVRAETFREILAGKLRYDPKKGRFRALLATAVRRNCIDQLRKRKPMQENRVHRAAGDDRITATLDRIADLKTGIDEKLGDQEWRNAVTTLTKRAVIAKVEDKQYQIFDAYVLKDFPVEQVMETLSVSRNQVYLAKKRVGEVYEAQARKAAKQLDAPAFPRG